ncbi:hypothetical protein Mag101_07445 [Microbulbifer agarilyticus]|uniref:Uncharacterized protein n=1 Tax=Microbulbifer agarilyticus TaxID=260552 RepID=A0A1Q2M5I9_9GAMM|nr:phage tail length tape measure family protein [Microbulbifer agarilyticus]AQQ67492.1 hypothetical protein Mag101_07445 [Microbulbifer agarilyticus]
MAKTATIATLVANLEMNSASFRKEMDQARARTKSFTKDLRNTSAANDGFARSMRGAAQGVVAIDGPLGGVAGRLGAVNSLVTGGSVAWAGLGVAIAGATAVMYKSVRAAEEMERGQLKIEALLKATEGASGRTAAQLDEQARAVARNTLASISGIRDAQGVLVTFRSVQTDVFDKAIVLSQDLAAVMGGSAKSAALQLGKALEEPSTGLTALRRAGVSFTEAEKEQIRVMEESGRVAEAQRLILAKLEKQVGGAGAAEAGGLAGKVDSLSQSWQEFLEAIGETRTAGSSIEWLTGAVENLRRGLAPTESELQELEFKKLHKQYVWHQEMLAKAKSEGVQAQVNIQTRLVEKYRLQLKEIQDARISAQKKEAADAIAAEHQAKAAREQMARELAESELKRNEKAGAAQLIQLDAYLADRRGKIELEHEQRLQKIASLQISEQELAKRGFASLEALRAEYIEREKAQFDQQLAELAEREARIAAQNESNKTGSQTGFTSGEQDDAITKLEALKQSWLSEVDLLQVQHDQEMAILDEAHLVKQERLAEQLSETNATKEQARQANLALQVEYERNLTALETKHAKEREKLQQITNKSKLQMFAAGAVQVLAAAAGYNKKAAKLSMAAAVYETGVSAVKNIARASEIGFPQNIPAIAGAIAQGVQIAGMLSSLKGPGGSGGDSASLPSAGGIAAAPSSNVSANDQFVEAEPTEQPGSQVSIFIQGDLIGDNAETIADKITTLIEEQDLVIIPNGSRQAQELTG